MRGKNFLREELIGCRPLYDIATLRGKFGQSKTYWETNDALPSGCLASRRGAQAPCGCGADARDQATATQLAPFRQKRADGPQTDCLGDSANDADYRKRVLDMWEPDKYSRMVNRRTLQGIAADVEDEGESMLQFIKRISGEVSALVAAWDPPPSEIVKDAQKIVFLAWAERVHWQASGNSTCCFFHGRRLPRPLRWSREIH